MEIKADDICVSIHGKEILKDVNIEMRNGEMVAITGASGCGKTTLLNCLGLTQPIKGGKITIFGNDVTNWKDKEKTKFWQEHATFIYQDYGIIEEESVAFNITLNKKEKKLSDVHKVLQQVGLKDKENDLAIILSGGEKQRLGIARAIFKKASIIYADEPTASLDTENRESIISLLRQCAKQGCIVVLATHDERLVNMCDKVIHL